MNDPAEKEDFIEALRTMSGLSNADIMEIELCVKELEKAAGDQTEIEKIQEKNEPKIFKKPDSKEDDDDTDIRYKIGSMSLKEKIKLALYGDAACRQVLINDSNKLVQRSVLKNPGLRESEIEEIACNRNVAAIVFRDICNKKAWMKPYIVKLNMVYNPKVPVDLALKWLRYLVVSDLRKVAKSKDVSSIVANMARKKIAAMQKKAKGGG